MMDGQERIKGYKGETIDGTNVVDLVKDSPCTQKKNDS